MVHDLRSMCDAVAYMVKSDVEWRALPVDPPPLEAACTIDSQMVKAHDTVPRATNGYQRLPTATNGGNYARLRTSRVIEVAIERGDGVLVGALLASVLTVVVIASRQVKHLRLRLLPAAGCG
jgi:hypothetical protein